MKIQNNRFALISTYNKNQLQKICKVLKFYKIGIIATDSTSRYIRSHGFDCKKISDVTDFNEILDGRVKTLHPLIHASLLQKRNNKNHIAEIKKNNYLIIDFVIVNLYPFKQVAKKKLSVEKIIEMIDIGGSALLRSSCKNFESVTTINGLEHYQDFINELNENHGKTSLNFRKRMAIDTFHKTSDYDFCIYNWLNSSKFDSGGKNIVRLMYGENPNQKAQLQLDFKGHSILDSVISDKNISYNNILDVSSGIECINEFLEPTCVIIKHNNPCGVSSSSTIKLAYKNALDSDPISAFGGVFIFNRTIDIKTANDLFKKYITIICAPSFTKKALFKLKSKRNLILIITKKLKLNKYDKRTVVSGMLSQIKNFKIINKRSIKAINQYRINDKIISDLIFALKVCKHVKSNAIVLTKNKTTIGIGAGQMSRVDAAKIALSKIKTKNKIKKFVAASDGFFPFNDCIKLLKKNNCNGLITPSGSKNDNNLIKYVKKNHLNLFFTIERFFKH